METGDRDQEEEVGDRRTPVDLQDIVEKLNNAIRDAKSNMNTMEAELSPIHNKNYDWLDIFKLYFSFFGKLKPSTGLAICLNNM